jgi:hypothetical protein
MGADSDGERSMPWNCDMAGQLILEGVRGPVEKTEYKCERHELGSVRKRNQTSRRVTGLQDE